MSKDMHTESEWVWLVRSRYEPAPDVEMSYEDENNLLCLLNAPEHYGNENEMLSYAKENPKATAKDLVEYWDSITPDGLAPEDDGTELLEDDD